eukprot:IDg12758t1
MMMFSSGRFLLRPTFLQIALLLLPTMMLGTQARLTINNLDGKYKIDEKGPSICKDTIAVKAIDNTGPDRTFDINLGGSCNYKSWTFSAGLPTEVYKDPNSHMGVILKSTEFQNCEGSPFEHAAFLCPQVRIPGKKSNWEVGNCYFDFSTAGGRCSYVLSSSGGSIWPWLAPLIVVMLLLIAGCILLTVCCLRRKRRKERQVETPPQPQYANVSVSSPPASYVPQAPGAPAAPSSGQMHYAPAGAIPPQAPSAYPPVPSGAF